MAKALFCSAEYIKQKSIISGNVDSDKMVQFIETAQDMHIQNYMGTNLFRKMKSLIVSGEINDVGNNDYKTLLIDYIKPMLVWYAQADYIPFSAFTISSGGVFKHTAANGEVAQLEEINRLASLALDKAIFYTDRFLEYMRDNKSKYSEYTEPNDDMSPDKSVSGYGWFLG